MDGAVKIILHSLFYIDWYSNRFVRVIGYEKKTFFSFVFDGTVVAGFGAVSCG